MKTENWEDKFDREIDEGYLRGADTGSQLVGIKTFIRQTREQARQEGIEDAIKIIEEKKKKSAPLGELSWDVKPILNDVRKWDFWRFGGFSHEDMETWAEVIAKYILASQNEILSDVISELKKKEGI